MRTIIVTLAALAAALTGSTTFAQAAAAGGYPTATAASTVPDRTIRATPYGTMTADGTYAERLADAEEMPYYVGEPAADDTARFDPTPAAPNATGDTSNGSVFKRDSSSALAWILGIGALALVFSAVMATLRSRELDPTPIDAASFTDLHRTAAH
ncbi:MAG: hypothetical protein JWN72_908 [Thermoleophilia bacterium]|nr:hypothetical protein [Thermoleophilia bacterium]